MFEGTEKNFKKKYGKSTSHSIEIFQFVLHPQGVRFQKLGAHTWSTPRMYACIVSFYNSVDDITQSHGAINVGLKTQGISAIDKNHSQQSLQKSTWLLSNI